MATTPRPHDPARYREWYRRNKARKLAKARAYYRANKAAIQAQRKEYRRANFDVIKAAQALKVGCRTARAVLAAEQGEWQ